MSMDCSLPGSSVHGIFQARVLEWGAIAFSAIKDYEILNQMPTLRLITLATKASKKNVPFIWYPNKTSERVKPSF